MTELSEDDQVHAAHVLVEDFQQRINMSAINFNPEILAAVLIKKAGVILKEHHKDSKEGFIDSVTDNFKQLYLLS